MAATVDNKLYTETGDYLLQTESWHDCHFIVGQNKERIGAVKSCLINQSPAWWLELSPDSLEGKKGDIPLPDIEPPVFRLLLKHCYGGLEDCSSLSEETVMQLCNYASKYNMTNLMNKIAVRLQPTTVDEVFSALHCLVYYNLQGVKESVEKIVQTETKKIFAYPNFLKCDTGSVTFIAKQEKLNCEELELWKAVVTWAKEKAHSDEGPELRKWMLGPLQHVRLLTLGMTDMYYEVFTQGILSRSEMVDICRGDPQQDTLCNNTVVRVKPNLQPDLPEISPSINVYIKQNTFSDYAQLLESKFCIVFSKVTILLESLTCKRIHSFHFNNQKTNIFGCAFSQSTTSSSNDKKVSLDHTNSWSIKSYSNDKTTPVQTDSLKITVTVTPINHQNIIYASIEAPVVIIHQGFLVKSGESFTFPTLVNGKGVVLRANSMYKIEVVLNEGTTACNFPPVSCWSPPNYVQDHDFQHGRFYCSSRYINGEGQTSCYIHQFTYSVASD